MTTTIPFKSSTYLLRDNFIHMKNPTSDILDNTNYEENHRLTFSCG